MSLPSCRFLGAANTASTPRDVQQIEATHCWKFPCLQVLWFGSAHSATCYEDLNRPPHQRTNYELPKIQEELENDSLDHLRQLCLAKNHENREPYKSPKVWVCQWFKAPYCLLLCQALLSKFGVHSDARVARFCSSWIQDIK